ncbi:mulitfunctional PTS system fructose-like transporter subunit IIA/phosphocarrier protein HPr/phosphoenolpyruvate-protein phosphotransferase [Moraxella macacae 0408225]|uniref:phosphoenolpyruvate--protein phosphotransferase n=1 Tax=Moraxella macacae 0408225 TaxID=1230338 RepID=L2FB95_9GAMM|nr:phosphoenolpyruvate--protein phosphotransferase [Moraxella macacae]ELA09708.1 mulitfunctional PTS system fructose-like transporter subunit IIA/phosphocarrier protein HPr/phosphoenolpyruvate-protein phosphotransferase [Moraxella macacae 0408225]
MLALTLDHIFLQQHAENKADALALLADILVKENLTTDDYLQGLLDRENQSTTYLGQGIAIPHGTQNSQDAILNTGVRIAHFPKGVDWGNDNTVYLAVAIATKSDEHLQVLQLLTSALNKEVKDDIRQAKTADDILAILNAMPESLVLHENLIQTGVKASDLDELAYHGYQLLKAQNLVSAGFLTNLSTKKAIFLQPNVWAVLGDTAVNQPAVAIVKNSQVIDFNQQKLQTLVLIANHSSLDQQKLQQLLDVLFQSDLTTDDRRKIAGQIQAKTIPDWQKQTVVVPNQHGLHARPATQLVNMVKGLSGEIKVAVDGVNFVSAKSLTNLLALGANYGQTLTFIAEPNSESEQALPKVIRAVKQGLGETVEPIVQSNAIDATSQSEIGENLTWVDPFVMPNAKPKGIGASQGVAVGQAVVITPKTYAYQQTSNDNQAEKTKLQQAIEQVKQSLEKLIKTAQKKEIAEIFTAHLALLDDPKLLSDVNQKIENNFTAPYAWHHCIEQTAKVQESLNNPLLAERAMDLRDVGDKVLALLCGENLAELPTDSYILVKHDLMPSDVARLDSRYVAGILTAVGGASSHSAIVARALGIPAVVGAGAQVLQVDRGTQILLNGLTGEFVINPKQPQIEHAIALQQSQQQFAKLALDTAQQPAITLDKHHIEVAVNIGDLKHAKDAVTKGAEGVGLLRTEFVFMKHNTMPDVQTQILDYKKVFEAMADRPVVVRTLDVGGDKPLPYLVINHEENPFLGVRGVRLTLRRPDIFKEQLTALVQASQGKDLRIMFPMIARLEEWQKACTILDDVLANNPHDKLQVGMMIEVPSAAIMAEKFAPYVDFFSIGTNDLTQYTLAIDRGHPVLSAEADGLHPSVLRLIDNTVKYAHKHGKWVGVCGELGADTEAIPVLLGLGVDELSVSLNQIPLVKMQIRNLSYQSCQSLATQALACDTATSVRALSQDFLSHHQQQGSLYEQ